MKRIAPLLLRGLTAASFLAVIALVNISCQSTSGESDPGFYSREPVSPIEGATFMQDRIGQIQRSNIR